MPTYLTPGVYIREAAGPRPVESVGTSTAGFAGISERGPLRKAVLVTSFAEYQRVFGDFIDSAYLAYAVRSFFAEGGTRAYVVRAATDTAYSSPNFGETEDIEIASSAAFKLVAKTPGTWPSAYSVTISPFGDSSAINLEIKKNGKVLESYSNLSLAEGDENYLKAVVDSQSDRFSVTMNPSFTPGGVAAEETKSFTVTGEDVAANVGDDDWLASLKALDQSAVQILVLPEARGDASAQVGMVNKAIAYAESAARKDCIVVADSNPPTDQPGSTWLSEVKDVASGLSSSRAALYFPWVTVLSSAGTEIAIPPSGAVAGIMARTDALKGVHKAPAGVNDGAIRSARGVTFNVTDVVQAELNPNGVNALRSFSDAGLVVWGARTLSIDPQFKYVNVRRLLLSIEQAIEEGTRWAVMEPNTRSLWNGVKRDITAFLASVWRDGGLVGATEQEAFYVVVDESNNTQADRDAGRLNIDVGVAPVRPAEFIIVRVTQALSAA